MLKKLIRAKPVVRPDEIRAMREEAGWSPERLAEAVGVLPLEVTAWESGAVGVDLHQAARIRWSIDQAEYEARLPRSACYWTRANEARLQGMRERGFFTGGRADREVAAHARGCAECMRAEMLRIGMPPPPPEPAEPGLRGSLGALRSSIGRLPAWLRVPLQGADMAVRLAAFYLGLWLLDRIQGEDTAGPSLTGFLAIGGGILWFRALAWRLLPLSDRRPYLAGQLFAAGIALPAILLAGLLDGCDLASAGLWMFAGLVSAFVGGMIGNSVAKAGQPENETEDEERVVVVPQQAEYFQL
ncbi:MAG: helix-turn-helix transcriptional regulator [Gemmatimonadetes bacterium]|nr:helix-turn-helix transcriptional regulator [Gemmatimonadota bacterium]